MRVLTMAPFTPHTACSPRRRSHHTQVHDWDFFSSDDLIGQADVPLSGLLE
jgi:hypothetical protein